MTAAMPNPYEVSAADYWSRGWVGVLPIPGKSPPPDGYTGGSGTWPSRADVQDWIEVRGDLNIGLRLPAHVIGIDVDHYGGKPGKATFASAKLKWGRLPPTWISTSRTDGVSGIRLFAVPEGLRWPSELPGGGVEIIRLGHRYAMAWPSVHPEGRIYEWIAPSGDRVQAIPGVDDLPDLPAAWVQGLTDGREAEDLLRASMGDAEAMLWIEQFGQAGAPPCPRMLDAVIRAGHAMTTGASRHDAATRATARVAHLIQEGHGGGLAALGELRVAFMTAVVDEGRGAEFSRMIAGAVRLAAVLPVAEVDPCTGNLFASGILPATQAQTPEAHVVPSQPARVPLFGPVGDPGGSAPDPDLITHRPAEDTPVEPTGPPVDPAYEMSVRMEVSVQRARREARRLLDVEERAAAFREPPSTFTLAQELELPDDPVLFRVAEVLPTNGNVLLTAQFKAGKTTLVNNLARALADGLPFLDAFDVSPLGEGTVSLWNYEVSRGQYRRWLRDVGITTPSAVTVLNLRGFHLPVEVEQVQDWIVDWHVRRNTQVWIVDPFARAWGGDNENDNSQVGRYLDTLDVIKERAGIGELVLSTHTGRAVAEEGQERARGATRLDDWADVRWSLTKDAIDQRFFSAMGRDVEYPEKGMSFDEHTRLLSITDGNRASVRHARIMHAVFAAISANHGISKRRIDECVRTALGSLSKDSSVADAIAALERAGRIRIDRSGQAHYHYLTAANSFGSIS